MTRPALGVCYYPEHWPQENWSRDAAQMVDAGLSIVRIGEFAWSRIEPQPDAFDWQWLDEAFKTLASAGLKVVMGTPTATPPRWMLDKYPDMLAADAQGKPRRFGSRRHYCFSHENYRQEAVRIATLMAQRYGHEKQLCGWQIDNEYGCHDTVVSYSDHAGKAFQTWLKNRYQSIENLNLCWGNVFWSMEYRHFNEIDLPMLTVTEANPAHQMDFRRFSSDQVVRFNQAQANAIRPHSDMPLIHNYMGRITDFDHFKVGADLDIASWDSYPLGFLEDRASAVDDARVNHYYRQGDPDFQAFHHDLYRAVGEGRWWIMEQQPGPVNWAPNNPAPLPGMVRLWTLEALAHEAEAVCYFRWRQAPFAQEQMHAGLLRPDGEPAAAFPEVRQTAHDIRDFGALKAGSTDIALVFDYESAWAWQVQPQGSQFDYFDLLFSYYKNLRRLGLNIDLLPVGSSNLADYKLLIIPGLMCWSDDLRQRLDAHQGTVLIGPRSGSKTETFSIPEALPPDLDSLGIKVKYVESLRAGVVRKIHGGGNIQSWFEVLELSEQNPELVVKELLATDEPVLVASGKRYYLAAILDDQAYGRIFKSLCADAGIATENLPQGLRTRRTGSHQFWFNYSNVEVKYAGETIPPAGVVWKSIK